MSDRHLLPARTSEHVEPPRRRAWAKTCAAAFAAMIAAVGFAGVAAAAPSAQDTQWMIAAHQSNLAEIAAGTAAQQQATSVEVKQLGELFIQDHTLLDADLTAAATQLGVQLPTTPSAEQQQQLATVKTMQGAAFDTAWIAGETAGHQQSAQLTQAEATSGGDPAVVALATKALPKITSHLTMLQASPLATGTPTRVNTGSGGQAATSGSSTRARVVVLTALGLVLLAGSALLLRPRRRA